MSKKHQKSKQYSSKTTSQQRHKPHKRNLPWLWISLGVLFIAVVGILLFNSMVASSIEITPAQAYVKFQKGASFLDVRSQDEWDQFHIAGSILIPLDQLQSRLGELPGDKEIVVVCLSGHRARSGVDILQQARFKHVYCLGGGLQAWMAANYPIERGSP